MLTLSASIPLDVCRSTIMVHMLSHLTFFNCLSKKVFWLFLHIGRNIPQLKASLISTFFLDLQCHYKGKLYFSINLSSLTSLILVFMQQEHFKIKNYHNDYNGKTNYAYWKFFTVFLSYVDPMIQNLPYIKQRFIHLTNEYIPVSSFYKNW